MVSRLVDYLQGCGAYADRQRSPLPDLVLLDLKMPGIDGFQVLRQIKTEPRLKRILVVVLTSSSAESDISMAYSMPTVISRNPSISPSS